MLKKLYSIVLVFLVLCLFAGAAYGASFDITAQTVVEDFDIAGLTVWLDVSEDFAVDSFAKGAGIPGNWWEDSNLNDIVIEPASGATVLKIGYSDFMAAAGMDLVPMEAGLLYTFDYSGTINDLFLAKLPDINNVDHIGNGDILAVFDGDGVDFTSVPIPSAAWLLASGLIGFVTIRRKKS